MPAVTVTSWLVRPYLRGLPPQSASALAEFDKLEKSVLWVPGLSFGQSLFVGSLPAHFRGLHSHITDQPSLSIQIPRPLPLTFDSPGWNWAQGSAF